MRSRCLADGSYNLELMFNPGINARLARVLIQSQVNLAVPLLPDIVKRASMHVYEKLPMMVALVTVSVSDDNRDTLELSDYVNTTLKVKLSQLPGVSNVAVFGGTEYRLRVLLDHKKMVPLGHRAPMSPKRSRSRVSRQRPPRLTAGCCRQQRKELAAAAQPRTQR
jgi:multidrug efflux pump subunit AcrB